MEIEWDDVKRRTNLKSHGVDFAEARFFDFAEAEERLDDRFDGTSEGYREERIEALGPIGNTLYVMIYTMRGEICRIISLRKAQSREVDRYVESRDTKARRRGKRKDRRRDRG